MKYLIFFAITFNSLFATAQNVSFASSDLRFPKELPPVIKQEQKWTAVAWKGEKVHTQILLWSKQKINGASLMVSDLKDDKGNTIKKENVTTGFLEYVITDGYADGCGRSADSSYVADRINTVMQQVDIDENTTQPAWLSIKVPSNVKAGTYTGTVTVKADRQYLLNISLQVINRTLPPPGQWKYDLDLWQHPAAIARVHNVPLWSDAHFAAMKPYYTMLANAGQKHITASIVNEPWGHQTYDDYPSLIKWTKKKDGTWSYDYSLFDKYVAFAMKCGITAGISCFSIAPWKIAFRYYDEASQKDTLFTGAIGTPAYNAFMTTMLKDFAKHLKEKKWFNITYIAMDERPMPVMKSIIQLLKTIDKDWKIALAGNEYHPQIENDIFDYSIASKLAFSEGAVEKRRQQGKSSTWYTCCIEKYPNSFTFSPPAEQTWMGWYTAATGMDGYLRWAFNSWPKDPLKDSRFTSWAAGDVFLVYPYPGTLSSIRFEKIIEGIQDFEKIRLLREEYKKNNQVQRSNELETALRSFNKIDNLSTQTAADMLNRSRYLLNQ